MAATTYNSNLAWVAVLPEDRRFRQLAVTVLAAFMIASILASYIQLPPVERKKVDVTSERMVKLLLEKKKPQPLPQKKELTEQEREALRKAEEERRKRLEEARQKSEEERKKLEEEARKRAELDKKKLEEQQRKTEDKQKLDEQRKLADQQRRLEEQARRQAEAERQRVEAEQRRVAQEKERGAAAAKNLFGDVQDLSTAPVSAAATDKVLKSGKAGQGSGEGTAPRADVLTQRSGNAAKASGGIDTGALSGRPGAGGGGDNLDGRSTTQVGAVDMGEGGTAGTSEGKKTGSKAGRSERDISQVMEKYKGAMQQMYERARRANPTLGGKVVFEITIDASGRVTSCKIISTELNEPDLENKLVAKVKGIDFGAAQVDTVTVTYPVDFIPNA